MATDERLNIQIEKKLAYELKQISIKLSGKRKKYVPLQSLADIAIKEYIQKIRKEVM